MKVAILNLIKEMIANKELNGLHPLQVIDIEIFTAIKAVLYELELEQKIIKGDTISKKYFKLPTVNTPKQAPKISLQSKIIIEKKDALKYKTTYKAKPIAQPSQIVNKQSKENKVWTL